jgi:hypothetical protein
MREMSSPDYASLVQLEGAARDLCSEADSLETMQYVFLSVALVAGGVGTYLLLTDREPDNKRARVTLRPRVGFGRAQLDASVRF